MAKGTKSGARQPRPRRKKKNSFKGALIKGMTRRLPKRRSTSSTKAKTKLTLMREPTTADDIDALFKALTGSEVPMTEEERSEVEAILAEEPTAD
jgi:hypothetical protein